MRNETLTKAEMTIMNLIWDQHKGLSVAEVRELYEEPKPADTTVATFMKILEKKGYLKAEKTGSGRSYTFFPLISKETYSRRTIREVKKTLFAGSAESLLNFFVREENISEEDLKELLDMIKR